MNSEDETFARLTREPYHIVYAEIHKRVKLMRSTGAIGKNRDEAQKIAYACIKELGWSPDAFDDEWIRRDDAGIDQLAECLAVRGSNEQQ